MRAQYSGLDEFVYIYAGLVWFVHSMWAWLGSCTVCGPGWVRAQYAGLVGFSDLNLPCIESIMFTTLHIIRVVSLHYSASPQHSWRDRPVWMPRPGKPMCEAMRDKSQVEKCAAYTSFLANYCVLYSMLTLNPFVIVSVSTFHVEMTAFKHLITSV